MLNKESMYKWMIIFMVVISFGSFSHADKIIYVDDDATGANDGSSWQNAYIYLQDALADANSSDKPIEIRVAQGIYKPDMGAGQTGGDREASFSLINDVTISGGYAGVLEVDPNARDIDMYETILSGDLFGDDKEVNDQFGGFINEPTRSENSYHVVTVSDTDSNAVIDGFLITAGNANGPILEIPYPEDIKFQRGGGIYCSSGDPNITHCIIIRNSGNIGGGMYNTNSNPILTNCIFRRNSSYYGGGMVNIDNSSPIMLGCIFDKNLVYHMGGGIYNIESNSILKNCEFVMNKAVTILGKGGGIYNYYSDLTLTDCIFDDNYSQENGGGIHNTDYPSPMFSHEQTLINCTFTRNSAGNGGGIYNEFANPTLINCKFIENCASYDGGGILNYEEGEPILNNCEFVGNTAARNGGGIYVSYHTILNNCILSGNLALQNGGGIYIQTGLTHIQRNLILDNCALYGNRANKLGGGIFSSGRVKASISNSILWANSATQGKQVALLVYVGPNTNSYYSSAAFQYSNIQEGDSGIYKEFEAG